MHVLLTMDTLQSSFFWAGVARRHGYPLSPNIFVLAVEPLAMKLKNNNIQGIKIGSDLYKIEQYADDTFYF